METFSALLSICAGNSPVTGEFHAQRPVTRSFDVFFDLRLNKRWSKQSCLLFDGHFETNFIEIWIKTHQTFLSRKLFLKMYCMFVKCWYFLDLKVMHLNSELVPITYIIICEEKAFPWHVKCFVILWLGDYILMWMKWHVFLLNQLISHSAAYVRQWIGSALV